MGFVALNTQQLGGTPTVVLATGPITIQFQLAPGTAASLGIANAPFVVSQNGNAIKSGTTNADGAIVLDAAVVGSGGVTIHILDTDYDVSLVQSDLADTVAGHQKRLDMLGYLTGYQLAPIGSDVPDDGVVNARTLQAILNFQTDQGIGIDEIVGPQTMTAFKSILGF